MPERFALYYAPAVTDPLWLRAAQWIGRDPTGRDVPETAIPGLDADYRHRISVSARRYGFHATLKAPMALAPGRSRDELEVVLAAFGEGTPQTAIGRLELAFIDGFLALIPAVQSDELTASAGSAVAEFEAFRATTSAEDREKRIRHGNLSEHQIELLDRYGYPYVMDEFRFHMTLTDRLPEAEREAVMAAAAAWFEPILPAVAMLDRVVLFHEPESGAPFVRLEDFELQARLPVDA